MIIYLQLQVEQAPGIQFRYCTFISAQQCARQMEQCACQVHVVAAACTLGEAMCNVHVRCTFVEHQCARQMEQCAHWSSSVHARWSNVHVRVHIGAAVCTQDGAMCMLGAHWSCSVHARWSNVHVRVHIGAAVCTQDGAMCMLGAHWSSSVHARWSNVHVRCTLEQRCARQVRKCAPRWQKQ